MAVKTTNISLNKNDFLKNDTVKSFLTFLAGYVSDGSGNSFKHKYIDRKSHTEWECTSVFDAYKNYSYPLVTEFRTNPDDFCSIGANATVLNDLAEALQRAFGKRQNSDDPACGKSEKVLIEASQRVFVWGGVAGAKERKANTRAGNYLWLKETFPDGKGLADAYKCAEKTFTSDKPDLSNIGKAGIRSNAGFTKIYSLLFDDFIIYDSRVAAALGLFVVKFCKESNRTGIPDELNFGWMPPKEGKSSKDAKIRDPSSGELVHQRANNERRHAHSNIRANWILGKVLSIDNSPKSPFNGINNNQDKLRALEAAFFMIGYDIGKHPWIAKQTEKNEPAIGQSSSSSNLESAFELRTIAKDEPFTISEVDLGYQIMVGKSKTKLFLPRSFIAEIETDMAGEELNIGSNRDNPPEGSLGARLNSKVCKTAMASYVAPLLVHLGVAETVNKRTIRIL